MSLAVIVPSRGRPQNIERLIEAWNTTNATADLVVGLDDDDPALADYPKADLAGPFGFDVHTGPRLRMVGTLNKIAASHAPLYDHVGFIGDDHIPRTVGWDKTITQELDLLGTGIVYGNDLLQGANLPTAVFMTSDIVKALGWMALPGARHLYVDDAWRELGRALDALTYLPDVIIEHLHPVAGKTEWDDSYRETNSGDTYDHDRGVFERWLADGLPRDIAKIRAFHG